MFRAARAEKVHMHLLHRQTRDRVRRVFVPAENMDSDEASDFSPGRTADAAPLPQQAISAESIDKPRRIDQGAVLPERKHVPDGAPPGAGVRDVLPAKGEEEGFRYEEAAPSDGAQRPGFPKADLVRGFEYEKDKYVEFESRELEDLAPRSSGEMQIVEFVGFAEVDPVYLENSYYVAPDKQGEKPYALLFAALQQTGRSAIAEFVMHRRDQIILLRSGRHGIIGHTLFHEDEVRQDAEFRSDAGLVVPKEMDLAVRLIEALTARFEPEKFKDKYRERLKAAIAEKTAAETKPAAAAGRTAPVIDIMAALKESLTQAKKPAGRETRKGAAAPPGIKKRKGGKG